MSYMFSVYLHICVYHIMSYIFNVCIYETAPGPVPS